MDEPRFHRSSRFEERDVVYVYGYGYGVFARQFRCGFGFVIPAKAGIQKQRDKHTVWMPACAGMTVAGWFEIELAGKAGYGEEGRNRTAASCGPAAEASRWGNSVGEIP
jgi:hypothetical protein